MKKYSILFLGILIFFSPSFAFAAHTTYIRTPTGNNLTSPVIASITGENGISGNWYGLAYWNVAFVDVSNGTVLYSSSQCVSTGIADQNFSITAPSGTGVYNIWAIGYDNSSCTVNGNTTFADHLENGNGNILFTITAPSTRSDPLGIISASSTFTSAYGFGQNQLINYVFTTFFYNIIGSAMGYFLIMLPFIMGLIIIGAIVYLAYRAFKLYKYTGRH